MIGTISGTLRYKNLGNLIIEAGGVGYKVHTTTDTALDLIPGENAFLWTYLSVRENALDLFGFIEKETLDIFELLITISGIGPKTALGILNVASPSMLKQAVAEGDTSYLTKVSGIGKKNAEKIVLELKDKLVFTSSDTHHDMRSQGDALEALVSLGYTERDARDALKKISKEIDETSDKVKAALKLLSTHA